MIKCTCDACSTVLAGQSLVPTPDGLCVFCAKCCFPSTGRSTRLVLSREQRQQIHRQSVSAEYPAGGDLGAFARRVATDMVRNTLEHAAPLLQIGCKQFAEHCVSKLTQRVLGGSAEGIKLPR
jgi:hypothetical protein